MKNDPIIHAKASKIVEAIVNELMKRKGSHLSTVITEALASLGGKEICDECNGTGKWKEKIMDKQVNCPKCKPTHPSEREIVDDVVFNELHRRYKMIMSEPDGVVRETMISNLLADLPHPSERGVLERFENIAGHMIPSPDGGWIRYAELFYKYRYLAEKQSKTENQ